MIESFEQLRKKFSGKEVMFEKMYGRIQKNE